MKKTFKNTIAALLLVAPISFAAASGGGDYDHAPIDPRDKVSLQRGAQIFVNNCLSCHSASAMRYNRLKDIGLSEDDIKKNLMFTTDKVGDVMQAHMSPADGKKWFGAAPPDLTLLSARLLQRPDTPDRLEQLGIRQSGYAARFMGTTRHPRR